MSSRAARSRAARASLLWNSLPSKKPQGQQCSHGNGWPQTSLINSAVSTPAIKRAASCTPRASTFSTWQPTHRWKMTAFKRWEQKREQRGDGAEELRGLCDTWACTLLRDFSLSGILLTLQSFIKAPTHCALWRFTATHITADACIMIINTYSGPRSTSPLFIFTLLPPWLGRWYIIQTKLLLKLN